MYFINILLLFSISGCTQSKQINTKEFIAEEREIIAVTDHLTALMISRDLKGLNELLEDDFTLTHI